MTQKRKKRITMHVPTWMNLVLALNAPTWTTLERGCAAQSSPIAKRRWTMPLSIMEKQSHTNVLQSTLVLTSYACDGKRLNLLGAIIDAIWKTAYVNNNKHKRYRHVAYRQLARFLFGIVGKDIRYVLPSCAVNVIWETFPGQQNELFTGFRLNE